MGKDEALGFYESTVGRPVPATSDLTFGEAAKVITALQAAVDEDAADDGAMFPKEAR